MFDDFEEWFAIRNRHDDGDIWAGKLNFSENNGISLEAIVFSNGGSHCDAPNCDSGTITGYLDYQRPTTIVEPWVQSRGGGSFGVDTPIVRAKSRLVASAVLKNIHLEDLNEKCFTALYMEMPAFNAWYAPQLIKTDYEYTKEKAPPEVSVAIDPPFRQEFELRDKTKVVIQSFAGTSEVENTTKVSQQTLLTLEFPSAIDYSEIRKRIWRLNTMFSFLLGHKMAQNPYRLRTNHTRQWNEQDQSITAELFFNPVFKSKTHHVEWHNALFLMRNCTLTPEELLNASSEHSDSLFYLMNMVLQMENPDKVSASDFSELVGCLEDFDITINGSGSLEDVKSARKALRKVVKSHGTDSDLQTFDEPAKAKPSRFSLAERLTRLQQNWSDCGFRECFEASEIIKIRNDIAHGRGVNLSPEVYEKIIWLNYHLCAMSRFHIFRKLGIQVEEIAAAFRRMGIKYGRYAPVSQNEK